MRVATLNTWGMRGDWQGRLPGLRDGPDSASDHYALVAELEPWPPDSGGRA
jgi:hypothetical protein